MSAFRSDKDLIRDYITGADHLHYAFLPEGIVAVNITHSNLPAKHLDVRKHLDIGIFRENVEYFMSIKMLIK
jgi:hypothetical protein